MKGRHQRARQHRQELAAAAERDRLRTEIAAETERGTAARAGAEQTRTARRRLEREQAATGRRLGPQHHAAGRLVRAAKQASTAVAAARSELDAVERQMSKLHDDTMRQLRRSGVKVRLSGVHPGADERYVATWYRKQTGHELENLHGIDLTGWIPDGTACDRDTLRPYADCTAADTTPQACWAWAIPPWLNHPDGQDAPWLRDRLGTTTSGAPTMPDRDYPGPPLPAGATLAVPWRHAPLLAQPADAAELAYWYHRSAWAQHWHPHPAPVPFWLPAEHTTGYPQARPLPDGTDVRLPYPAVFAAFSGGWRINPRTDDLPTELITTQLLMLYARGHAAHHPPAPLITHLGRLRATILTNRGQLPTPLQAVEAFGGTVEGLLLLAHPDGTPRDEFAWCIAVGHPTDFPTARILIPASRTASRWRRQVDNVTAGIALSCWHAPLTPTPPDGAPADPDTQATSAAAVRVLDIDATSPPAHTDHPATTHTTRAHLRRGHWRRQRVGAGRRDQRWTWIRPTTVNGQPTTIDQVYVLR